MRGNGPHALGNGSGGGGGASSSNGHGAGAHGSLNDSLEAYMTNLSAGAQQLQQPGTRAGSRCILLTNPNPSPSPSPNPAPTPNPPRTLTRCIVLTGLISRAGAADPHDASMTRLETGNECSKWGELLRVHVTPTRTNPSLP